MPDSQPADVTMQPDGPASSEERLRSSVRSTVHELNNALSVLNLTTELLSDDHMDLETASAQMREQVQQAIRLVENLHRIAREE
ncbi:MAG TPA: hypothetical protein QGF05_06415 [Dehalococcoidia bacterium]|nr:hypothetical protein [Dehalococcoidia bacterium]